MMCEMTTGSLLYEFSNLFHPPSYFCIHQLPFVSSLFVAYGIVLHGLSVSPWHTGTFLVPICLFQSTRHCSQDIAIICWHLHHPWFQTVTCIMSIFTTFKTFNLLHILMSFPFWSPLVLCFFLCSDFPFEPLFSF